MNEGENEDEESCFFSRDEKKRAQVLPSESGDCMFKAFDEEDLEVL